MAHILKKVFQFKKEGLNNAIDPRKVYKDREKGQSFHKINRLKLTSE